jgi:hypothetical protein
MANTITMDDTRDKMSISMFTAYAQISVVSKGIIWAGPPGQRMCLHSMRDCVYCHYGNHIDSKGD